MLNYAGPSDVRAKQFSDALRALGYREGSNLKLTHKWADGKMDELPILAAQLVADKVDVIIALGPAVWAARNATTTIPIVIAFSGDPVGALDGAPAIAVGRHIYVDSRAAWDMIGDDGAVR